MLNFEEGKFYTNNHGEKVEFLKKDLRGDCWFYNTVKKSVFCSGGTGFVPTDVEWTHKLNGFVYICHNPGEYTTHTAKNIDSIKYFIESVDEFYYVYSSLQEAQNNLHDLENTSKIKPTFFKIAVEQLDV